MSSLLAAAAAFLAAHFVIAGWRDVVARLIGTRTSVGVTALLIGATFVWMCFAYVAARQAGPAIYWHATPMTTWIQFGLTFIAFLFIVPGRLVRNPATVFQADALDRADIVHGVLRITRHPYLWGVALWAAGHVLVSGDAAGLVLFGAILALAVLGTFGIDSKRRRLYGDKWDAFTRETSNIPFAAIIAGRQSLKLGEIGWQRIALAIASWAALFLAHSYLFGAAPATLT